MRLRCEPGQSLIEVIVSVGIAVILAIALISAGLISSKTARSARNNTQATKLAEQTIEQIRVFRDRQGFGALTVGTCYTLNTSTSDPAGWSLSTASCPAGEPITLNNMIFSRVFSIADVSTAVPLAAKRLVTVTVSWSDGSTQSVTNQTVFSQWTSP